jgi:hypothetical protein
MNGDWWGWGPILGVGLPVAAAGLIWLIVKLLNHDWKRKPKAKPAVKYRVVMRNIGKPHLEARRYFDTNQLYGWCTICDRQVGKYAWHDWDTFRVHTVPDMETHRCPTVEDLLNNPPKWEQVSEFGDGRRNNN